MHYTDEVLSEISKQLSNLRLKQNKLFLKTVSLANRLSNDKAREYLLHGVSRRLKLLQRCVARIFELFPPDRIDRLAEDDRQDVVIYLHAFLINIYGVLENTALALAHEKNLFGKRSAGKLHFRDVGLFNDDFRNLLNLGLREYLKSENIAKWYEDYAKSYRDALSHRIPPYVPPAALNTTDQKRFKALEEQLRGLSYERDIDRIDSIMTEQIGLGGANPLFVHSFSENAVPLYLHLQVLSDHNTIEDILNKVLEDMTNTINETASRTPEI